MLNNASVGTQLSVICTTPSSLLGLAHSTSNPLSLSHVCVLCDHCVTIWTFSGLVGQTTLDLVNSLLHKTHFFLLLIDKS